MNLLICNKETIDYVFLIKFVVLTFEDVIIILKDKFFDYVYGTHLLKYVKYVRFLV